MSRAICPTCGSELELCRSKLELALSCSNCSWNSTGGRLSSSPSGACEAFMKMIPSSSEAHHLFSSILGLQKPRTLKWNSEFTARAFAEGGAVTILILLGCFGLFLGWRTGSIVDAILPMIISVLAFDLALGSATPYLGSLSKQNLLREGEVTVGRVVHQYRLSGSSKGSLYIPGQKGRPGESQIFYAFADRANRAFVGSGTDFSGNVGEGAAVVIFYNPLDPNQNVSTDCCYLTVRLSPT